MLQVRTRYDTPAPGTRLTARLVGSPYVVSAIADDSGRYELLLQSHVPSCDPTGTPEKCISQLVK
jgi:hypothetical protein